jgi:hypothetical protein
MHRTRRSLFFLAGYLIPTGIGFMLVPELMLKVLLSNGEYGDIFPRFVGVCLLGLGLIVVQVIRHSSEELYGTTLAVRGVILPWMLYLYLRSDDPLFVLIAGVVGTGLVFTTGSYLKDRRGS